jgi:hypothetical protein
LTGGGGRGAKIRKIVNQNRSLHGKRRNARKGGGVGGIAH